MPAKLGLLRPREQSSEGTRRAILRAAEALIAGGGEDGLSIRELCARAGVTAPTVYHHFGDKHGLVQRVVEACFAEFDRATRDDGAAAEPVERLRRMFDRYVAYGAAHPTHYRLLFPRRRREASPSAVRSYDSLLQGVRAVAAAGRLRVSAEEAAPAFWAAAHGVTSLVVAGFVAAQAPAVALVRDAMLQQLTIPAPRRSAARRGRRIRR